MSPSESESAASYFFRQHCHSRGTTAGGYQLTTYLSRYSTYFLTRALPPHGQIDTLEVNPLHAQVAQETFLNCDLYPFPSIHLGPALSTLKKLAPPGAQDGLQGEEVGYDLVFIDADKASVKDYFVQSLRLTRKGGVIIVDNAVRRGR